MLGKIASSRRFLIWDSFRTHITDGAKQHVKETTTVMGVIPGGCTKLLQPADVSWNAPFKEHYREMYEKWLQEPVRAADVTSAGNLRAPSRLDMVNWVIEAWKQLSVEVIVRSFESCGITSDDPDRIRCTKLGETVESAREALLTAGATVVEEGDDNESSIDEDDNEEICIE